MALKPYRRMLAPENIRYVSENTFEQGAALIVGTTATGTGAGLNADAPTAKAYAGAPASGSKFVGVSLDDVVDFNTDVTPRTSYPPTTRKLGEPFAMGEFVEVYTNMIVGTPTVEGDAYLAADSKFGTSAVNGNPVVGKWKTVKDADGYALLQLKVL